LESATPRTISRSPTRPSPTHAPDFAAAVCAAGSAAAATAAAAAAGAAGACAPTAGGPRVCPQVIAGSGGGSSVAAQRARSAHPSTLDAAAAGP
jgi:hypothetical protein